MNINVVRSDSKGLCRKDTWQYIEDNGINIVLCTELNETREDTEAIKKWVFANHNITILNMNVANFVLFCNLYSKHTLKRDLTVASESGVKAVLDRHTNIVYYPEVKYGKESVFLTEVTPKKARRKPGEIQSTATETD